MYLYKSPIIESTVRLAKKTSKYNPNKVVLLKDATDDSELTEIAPFTKGQLILDGKATAYVCLNHVCNLPTTEIIKMTELLKPEKP